jgi:hypothetical protein
MFYRIPEGPKSACLRFSLQFSGEHSHTPSYVQLSSLRVEVKCQEDLSLSEKICFRNMGNNHGDNKHSGHNRKVRQRSDFLE